MLQFEELRLQLLGRQEKLQELREAIGLESLLKEIGALEHDCARDGFWDDVAGSQLVLQRLARL
jgi:hypothetical protein